jgi:hypothetical protein
MQRHCAVKRQRNSYILASLTPLPPSCLSSGIAKFKDRTFVSTAGGQAGTPAYMAPEMFDGKAVSEKASCCC